MKETLDLYNTIKTHVSKLNYDWFLAKEKEFKSMEEYNDSNETISCDNYDIYVEDKWFEETDKYGISPGDLFYDELIIDLRTYCACYLPLDTRTGCGDHPIMFIDKSKPEPSNNIDEFAALLVQDIDIFFKEIIIDNVAFFKLISKVLTIVEEELLPLKKDSPNSDIYNNVLGDYLRKCTVKLHDKYYRELTIYNLTSDYISKLEFSATQDELVALLFVIHRAGFFTATTHITPILRFCFEHFRYKAADGEMVSPSSLNNLQKKYSNVLVSQYKNSKQGILPNGLNSVAEKLTAVLKKIE